MNTYLLIFSAFILPIQLSNTVNKIFRDKDSMFKVGGGRGEVTKLGVHSDAAALHPPGEWPRVQ